MAKVLKLLIPLFGLLTLVGCSGGNVESDDVKAWQQSDDEKKAAAEGNQVNQGQPDR